MRARDQVWSDKENESDNSTPGAKQPSQEQAIPVQPRRPEVGPEIQQSPSAPPAGNADEGTGQGNQVSCIHLTEAFFAALAAYNTTSPAPFPTATELERSDCGLRIADLGFPVHPQSAIRQADASTDVEARPGGVFVAFVFGALAIRQQDRAARQAAASLVVSC